MKDCPAAGCGTRIARELVMCHVHWARVPFELRRRITHALRRRDGASSPMFHAAAAEAEAIRIVDELEQRRQAA